VQEEHVMIKMVSAAQKDSAAADALIEQYLPFIRSETAKVIGHFPSDVEDELSIAMFAFYEAAMSYQSGKGPFLKLAALAVRNRLIDYYRREKRHMGAVSLNTAPSGEDEQTMEEKLADPVNMLERLPDRTAAQQEIQEFSDQLASYGLSLTEIAENCPKQDRTLSACMQALDYARRNLFLLEQLVRSKKLPLAQLASGARVERKTLERHRKYLVAILLAYTNGFEIIRNHLQMIGRKEAVSQ